MDNITHVLVIITTTAIIHVFMCQPKVSVLSSQHLKHAEPSTLNPRPGALQGGLSGVSMGVCVDKFVNLNAEAEGLKGLRVQGFDPKP